MTQTHTPTPFRIVKTETEHYLSGADNFWIARFPRRNIDDWNAQFIVRCVNNSHKIDMHDELVAALEKCVELGDMGPEGEAGKTAIAILAKTRGEA